MHTLNAALLFDLIPLAGANAPSAPFTHDRTLVALSMAVAVAGAFACLESSGRARNTRGAAQVVWVAVSGTVLGASLWSQHFIGLLAFESPLMHGFLWEPTLYSAIAGVIGCCAAFVVGGAAFNLPRFIIASAMLAACAIVMHYLGMQGLIIEGQLTYRPTWIALTMVGAFGCSMTAYLLAMHLPHLWMRAVAAFPMGAGSAGLHYTDIAATVITPRPAFAPPAPDMPALTYALITAAGMGLIALATLGLVARSRLIAMRKAAEPDTSHEYVVVIPRPAQTSDETVVHIVQPEKARR